MKTSDFESHSRMFLQSSPVEVRLAGFKSTTTALQDNGWQMSIETQHHMMYAQTDLRIAFKHDGIKQVALGIMRFNFRSLVHSLHNPERMADYYQNLGIEIQYVAPIIKFHLMADATGPKFRPFDARPQWMDARQVDLNDLALFKPIKTEDFEIYIHQKDEQEILDILLKKQDPKQKDIRQNQKRREFLAGNDRNQIPDLADRINADVRHQIVLIGSAA